MDTGKRRIRSLGIVMLAATAMLLMSTFPATAQSYPPPDTVGLVCPPSSTPGGVTPPGLVRSCELVGTEPGQTCRVSFEYNPVVEVGDFVTGDDNTVSFELVLPQEAAGQLVVVTAACFGAPEVLSASDTFEVAAGDDEVVDRGEPVTPERPLARTGVDAWLLVGAGVLLLALGLGLVLVRRRDGSRVSAGSSTHAE